MAPSALPFPLSPSNTWSSEQQQQWWGHGVLPPVQIQGYKNAPVTIISGVPGSGVSTTLGYIRHHEESLGNLVILWQPTANVLFSLFQTVTTQLEAEMAQRLRTIPGAGRVPEAIKPIWFWLATTYCFQSNPVVTRRWFARYWGISDASAYDHMALNPETLPASVIVDLLVDVARALGYHDIVCLCDNPLDQSPLYACLHDIAAACRGLRVVFGVTPNPSGVRWMNAAFTYISLTWSWNTLWLMCERLVCLVLGASVEIPAVLLPALRTLLLEELGFTPQGVHTLVTTLYWAYQKHGTIPADENLLTRDMYARSVPLRYDPEQRIVYRGIRPLRHLTATPLELFEYLYSRRGHVVTHRELLENVCIGSKDNLYQLISRIRAAIEPHFSDEHRERWVYLSNYPSVGFALENCC